MRKTSSCSRFYSKIFGKVFQHLHHSLSLLSMKIQYIPPPSSSSSFLHQSKIHRNPRTSPSSRTRSYLHQHNSGQIYCYKSRISYKFYAYTSRRTSAVKNGQKWFVHMKKEDPSVSIKVPSTKKGSIAGAMALIIGTSIGSGILALPKRTSPAGLLPSSISLTLCWGFLLFEALLLAEINVGLLKRKKRKTRVGDEDELQVISIRTMAQETLGEWGGALATLTYVFLGYTSMIAYASKSGQILCHMINIPESVSGFFFTFLFAILISVGGTRATDQVNQVLTASMIGLLVAIEVLSILFRGWSGFDGTGDWGKVPATIPVMIFSLVYHDLAPVLCAYLGGDIGRIRTSLVLGSVVPLMGVLVWDAIALGLSTQTGLASDPVDQLMREGWSGLSAMVEAFSLLAVGTSLIGSLLSFSQFFKEQLVDNLTWDNLSPSEKPGKILGGAVGNWWRSSKVDLTATAMVVAPTLFVSTTVPDAFSAATDIAGGYCMTMLYGVIPPAMAWAMHDNAQETNQENGISRTRPALLGLGLFACGIVVDQALLDLSIFHY